MKGGNTFRFSLKVRGGVSFLSLAFSVPLSLSPGHDGGSTPPGFKPTRTLLERVRG